MMTKITGIFKYNGTRNYAFVNYNQLVYKIHSNKINFNGANDGDTVEIIIINEDLCYGFVNKIMIK